jgi:hypothetical protein
LFANGWNGLEWKRGGGESIQDEGDEGSEVRMLGLLVGE